MYKNIEVLLLAVYDMITEGAATSPETYDQLMDEVKTERQPLMLLRDNEARACGIDPRFGTEPIDTTFTDNSPGGRSPAGAHMIHCPHCGAEFDAKEAN